jgi:D-aminoacyl-tRNA deacylase
MPVIVVSNEDLAGLNIKRQLLASGKFKETEKKFEGNVIYEEAKMKIPLITINRRLIEANHLDQAFKTDLFLFASKHKSESEKPALLVHAPGNWTDDVSFGGNPKELAHTSAVIIKQILKELTREHDAHQLDYDVTSEVSHHGPTNLESPCVFVELGSNETYWQDPLGGKIVAETILKVLTEPFQRLNLKYAIGFGGPHYASNFNRIQLSTDFAVSHIAPKHVLDNITEDLVMQSISKTKEKVKYAILDWKGMVKPQRDKIIAILQKLNIEIVRVQKIQANQSESSKISS